MQNIPPKVLVLLGNCATMDEDFSRTTIVPHASTSKGTVVQKALVKLIQQYRHDMVFQLMTYLAEGHLGYVHTVYPFVSYNSTSYCENPPGECASYCYSAVRDDQQRVTGDEISRTQCLQSCRESNGTFDPDYFDEIIFRFAANSNERKKYCDFLYPKTKRKQNPSDDSEKYIYYTYSYPRYFFSRTDGDFTADWGDYGFFFSRTYSSDYDCSLASCSDSLTCTVPSSCESQKTDCCNRYIGYPAKKTTDDETSDGFSGHSGSPLSFTSDGSGNGQLMMPVSDPWVSAHSEYWQPPATPYGSVTLGNIGQRFYIERQGPAWVGTDTLPGAYVRAWKGWDESQDVQTDVLLMVLTPFEHDGQYCSDRSTCSWTGIDVCRKCCGANIAEGDRWGLALCPYVQNAGLAPMVDALHEVRNYLSNRPGSYNAYVPFVDSPVLYSPCQNTFLIYITDSLGNLDSSYSSAPYSPSTNMDRVYEQIDKLSQGLGDPDSGSFGPTKAFVLAVGMSEADKTYADQMASHGGTGHAYFADSAEEVEAQLAAIFEEIRSAAALSAPSGPWSASLTMRVDGSQTGNALQATFERAREFGSYHTTWTGYLRDFWYYFSKSYASIREDTPPTDYVLNLKDDYELRFRYDTSSGLAIDRYRDMNGDGLDLRYVDSVPIDGAHPLWEAGDKLACTDPAERRIFTITDANSSAKLATPDRSYEFNQSNLTAFSSYLGSDTSLFPACLGADIDSMRTNLVTYIRGTDVAECRNRQVSADRTWRLGDIIYSAPGLASYSLCYDPVADQFGTTACTNSSECTAPYSTCRKEEVAFVGANDGMLHAFRTGCLTTQDVDPSRGEAAKLTGNDPGTLGKELWAFIPKNTLPYLRHLADPAAAHHDYIDLPPYIVHLGGKQVLIGGMRMGAGTCAIYRPPSGKWCIASDFGNFYEPLIPCADDSDCEFPTRSHIPYMHCADLHFNGYCYDPSSKTFQDPPQSCAGSLSCVTAPWTSCQEKYICRAPSDTCTEGIVDEGRTAMHTAYNPSDCTGLSSYFALDITNPESPVFLWEFTHPALGLSTSGPAVIKLGGNYYIMFLNGPQDPLGSDQSWTLHAFILKLDSSLAISSVYVEDLGSPSKEGAYSQWGSRYNFGGRLFTRGVDVSDPPDENTDYVFFGYSGPGRYGTRPDFRGGVAMVYTGDTNPGNWIWDFHYFSAVTQPVTARLEAGQCFNQWYVYGGSGKYYSWSDAVPNASLFGFPFLCDDQYKGPDGQSCSTVNVTLLDRDNTSIPGAGEATVCSQFGTINALANLAYGWQISLNTGYREDLTLSALEQCVTDPAFSKNGIFFTTMDHDTTSLCGTNTLRSRTWGLNCATGKTLADQTCSNLKVKSTSSDVYLQTSSGAVSKLTASHSTSTRSDPTYPPSGASEWTTGAPTETAPIPATSTRTTRTGKVIHWIER